jgi:hypothetical protein
LELVCAFLRLNSAADRDDSEEGRFVRECSEAPDGWQEECDRMVSLGSAADAS